MQEPSGTLKHLSEDEYAEKQKLPINDRPPLFKVGDLVDVNGGRFYVRKITKKDLVLRGRFRVVNNG